MNLEHWQPAFPCSLKIEGDDAITHFSGVTLLDYFAAKAMQGFLAQLVSERFSSGELRLTAQYPLSTPEAMNAFARRAYRLAEAMIAARETLFVNQTAIE